MRVGLMESERKRERQGSGMASSVVVHAVVIGLAVYGTATAKVVVHRATPTGITVFHEPPVPPGPHPRQRTSRPRCELCPPAPIVQRPLTLPTINTKVEVPPLSWDSLVGTPDSWGTGHDAGPEPVTPEPGEDGVFHTVDVMAVPDARNPAPVYPAMLRDAGVDGSISARFVVDSTGRVAAASIAFLGGGNALFEQSVRRALEAARFSPALVNGRAVRVLMAQTFEFRLRH